MRTKCLCFNNEIVSLLKTATARSTANTVPDTKLGRYVQTLNKRSKFIEKSSYKREKVRVQNMNHHRNYYYKLITELFFLSTV